MLMISTPTKNPENKKFSPCCAVSPNPMRITARHIEEKGVGYNQGYTTVEGFFSLVEPLNESCIPFMDLRGHVFNNGKMAANGGLGVCYLTSSRIWGANAYYDYPQAPKNTAL
jgi:hypothetical protein